MYSLNFSTGSTLQLHAFMQLFEKFKVSCLSTKSSFALVTKGFIEEIRTFNVKNLYTLVLLFFKWKAASSKIVFEFLSFYRHPPVCPFYSKLVTL